MRAILATFLVVHSVAVMLLAPERAHAYDISPDFDEWSTTGLHGTCSNLIVFQNKLYVGGSFPAEGVIPSADCAVWDGTWRAEPHPDFNGPFVIHQGKLIASTFRYDGMQVEQLESEETFVPYVLASNGATLVGLGHHYEPSSNSWPEGLFEWNEALGQWVMIGGELTKAASGFLSFRALVAWQGGWVVMGEDLELAGTTPVEDVAYYDGTQWVNMGPAEQEVGDALAVYQGELLMGSFSGIFRWNGSGWESWAPTGYSQEVRTLTVRGDDLYAGGDFRQIGTIWANRIAHFDGSTWRTFGDGIPTPIVFPTPTPSVRAIAVDGQAVYAAGIFRAAGDVVAWSIARWNGSSWLRLGLAGLRLDNAEGSGTRINGICRYGNDLVAFGGFDSWNVFPLEGVALLHDDRWTALGPGLAMGVVRVALQVDSDLVAVGSFEVSGSDPIAPVARWDGTTWSSMASSVNGELFTAALVNGDLYVAGDFYQIDGQAVTHVARWDGSAWHPVGGTLLPTVRAIAEFEGDLVAAGSFLFAEGQLVNHVTRWDGAQWSAMGSGIGFTVRTLEVHDGVLYAGGEFAGAGHIVAWDGSQWNSLGAGVNAPVNDIVAWGGLIWVAGEFDQAGGVDQTGLAAWDPYLGSWVDPGLELRSSQQTMPGAGGSLFAWGSALYVIGGFGFVLENDGTATRSLGLARITDPVVSAPEHPSTTAADLRLHVQPNPFNPSVRIAFELATTTSVRVVIFDVRGRRVVELTHGSFAEGSHTLEWSGRDAAGRVVGSGVYFVRVNSGDLAVTRKIVLAK